MPEAGVFAATDAAEAGNEGERRQTRDDLDLGYIVHAHLEAIENEGEGYSGDHRGKSEDHLKPGAAALRPMETRNR